MKLTSIKQLHDYFLGVVERAEHHAEKVKEIIYPLLGMIIAFKDSNKKIELMGQDNKSGNLLWVFINGTRYAFRYNHSPNSIEIHKDTYKGKLVKRITNKNTLSELLKIFSAL